MTTSDSRKEPLNPLYKLSGLALFLVLFGLGLIGLVLPVIPGLLFLLLALYVLTRLSRRFALIANRNSWLRRALRRVGHVRTLPPVDLLRLVFWVSARGAINLLTALTGRAGKSASTAPGK
ncbi:MAG: DUF454 family protein [Gammaproteobacteria bacterium]|jgi:uncharacterized membrane protein YbaN (DUF454 family)